MNNKLKSLQIFARFLKNHEIYYNYLNNIKKDCSQYHKDNIVTQKIDAHNGKYNPFNYIRFAFLWSGTREGDDFWRRLHTEWGRSYCGVADDIAYIRGCEFYELKNQIDG